MVRGLRLLHLFPLLLLAYLPLLSPARAEPASVPNGGFEQVEEKNGLPVGWTAWAADNKCFELAAGSFALYLEYWCGTERVQNVTVSCTQVGQWLPLAISAPAPANATAATVLVYGASATMGRAYFDDVALRPLP